MLLPDRGLMKKKRPKPPRRPPPARARRGRSPGNREAVVRSPALQTFLQYKVVELSTVDEAGLERTINDWVVKGWNLDGVQFAMREASKRPAMAFVFFTRESPAAAEAPAPPEAARERLARLAYGTGPQAAPAQVQDPAQGAGRAQERLRQLAEEGDEEPGPRIVEGTRWVEFDK